MFQRRLKFLIFFLLGLVALLVFRLGWLQLVVGEKYQQLSTAALELPGQVLDTIRGSIYDVKGRLLGVDQPSYQVRLHYKLTRLYDERFWRYLAAQWARQEFAVEAQAQQWPKEQQELARQKAQGDVLLSDLVAICAVDLSVLQESIQQINTNIYVLRSDRARRRYYLQRDLTCPEAKNAEEIEIDLKTQIPDQQERLSWIFDPSNDVREMLSPQEALAVDEDVALMVEERIVGAALQMGRQKRLVSIATGRKREYPYKDAACHIIGQLYPVPALESRLKVIQLPATEQLQEYQLGDRAGEWGVERLFEERLRGRRGWVRYDRQQQLIEQIEPIRGSDVRLSLDIDLHRRIHGFFAGDNAQGKIYRGAAVVIDVPTSEIRALVSAPCFDLNSYYRQEQFQEINFPPRADLEKKKINRALSRNYMPGSTIKPTLLLAALESKIVTADSVYDCQAGHMPDMPASWWCYRTGHGPTNAFEAIKKSCDYYFVDLGEKMGVPAVLNWLSNAGFGRETLVWPDGFTDEQIKNAFFETPGHLKPVGGERPTLAHLRFMSVGLGALDGSVLQIANSMATIARNGVFQQVKLLLEPKVDCPSRRLVESQQHIHTVQAAMRAVVYEPGGTAHHAFNPPLWQEGQVTLYGKTGSTTDNSLFAGFARSADGRCLALAVLVEDNEGGPTVAAPIARQILELCGLLDYLPAPESLRK